MEASEVLSLDQTVDSNDFQKKKKIVLKKHSSSSISSYESDSELFKQMPLLPMPYSPSLPEEKILTTIPVKKPTGGDVLFSDFKIAETVKPTEDPETKCSDDFTCVDDFDVVDSVPTRSGTQKVEDDKNENHQEKSEKVENGIEISKNASPNNTTPQAPPKRICCSVFCSLFNCKYIFSRYTIIDLILNLGSIVLYIFDLVTDWVNAFSYYFRRDEDTDNLFYFGLTIVVLVLSSILMQFFSVWWEIEDNRKKKKEKAKNNDKLKLGCSYYLWIVVFHLFQLAPIFRYIRTIRFGIKSRYEGICENDDRRLLYDRKYKEELRDVSFIRFMESFLEAGPQLVLQIFIMIRTVQTPIITVLSVCVSLGGMSISFVAYERALRNTLEEKEKLEILPSFVLLLYRTFTTVSRVIALALLLNTNVWAWIGFFVGRWVVMSVIIAWQKTKFCNTKAKEYVYDAVIGFCYTFAYLNVHYDMKNRFRMSAYYVLTFFENLVMTICWFYKRQGGGSLINALLGRAEDDEEVADGVLSTEIALALVVAVIALYILGMFFLLIYYIALHPKARGINWCVRGEESASKSPHDSSAPRRPPCGDNYRTYRRTLQFRSWHSESVNFDPKQNADQRKKRPSSEVISPSPSMLYDSIPSQNKPSRADLTSAACSVYSMRNDYSGSGDCFERNKVEPNRNSVTSYKMAMRYSPQRRLDDAERDRHVTLLLEQKKREKREIEHQLSIVTRQVSRRRSVSESSEVEPLVKAKALHLYSPKSSISANQFPPYPLKTPERAPTFALTNLRHLRETNLSQASSTTSFSLRSPPQSGDALLNSDQSQRARLLSSGCGTFPRTARLKHMGQSVPPYARQNSLKTIREHQPTSRITAGSLMNLGGPRPSPGKSVPRTMSCTISPNEIIESMESTV